MYGSGYGQHMYGFGGFWMIILSVAVIVGVVIIIKILLDRGSRGSKQIPERSDSPIDILKKRYAAGEIDHDEFERRKQDIMTG